MCALALTGVFWTLGNSLGGWTYVSALLSVCIQEALRWLLFKLCVRAESYIGSTQQAAPGLAWGWAVCSVCLLYIAAAASGSGPGSIPTQCGSLFAANSLLASMWGILHLAWMPLAFAAYSRRVLLAPLFLSRLLATAVTFATSSYCYLSIL
jgi:hypothetical protein